MNVVDVSCPSCGRGTLEAIYRQNGVPVNSVVRLFTRDAALKYPRGDILLGYCPTCGFACNVSFDPSRVRYHPQCEESQSASDTFNSWHERLAGELIERHGLKGRHVVEIGCGKAEFLALLCRRGNNRGTGFDPAYAPGRTELPPGVVVHRHEFTADVGLTDVDLLCCKMTLEHVASPLGFLRAVRSALGEAGTPVYFQVPDAGRIYRLRAFQDIYYEHCSYFTEAALRMLFTAAGFRVEEVARSYANQYLAVHARAGRAGEGGTMVVHEASQRHAGEFRRAVGNAIATWRSTVRTAHACGRRVVLWGGGSKAVAFLTATGLAAEVDAVVDVNPRKDGTWLPGTGHEVVAPERLIEWPPEVVVIMNGVYRDEIRARLARMQLSPEVRMLDQGSPDVDHCGSAEP